MSNARILASYASNLPIFRNRIINGNFDIWQRGTSQINSGYGSADRWISLHNGSTKTASQGVFTVGQTEVPGNPKYYLRHVVSSLAGAGNHCVITQRIEGVETLAGQTATLSFWAKADSNKNIATELFQYFGTGGSPSAFISSIGVTTHSLTTSWQKFTTTVAIPSISGKTIGSDGKDCLILHFWFDAGSDFNSRTNSLGQQSGTFDIAQVQLEEGPVATPFERRPIGTELRLCQRYYYIGKLGRGLCNGCPTIFNQSSNNTPVLESFPFPVDMRATPTITVSGSIFITSEQGGYGAGSTLLGGSASSNQRATVYGTENVNFINRLDNNRALFYDDRGGGNPTFYAYAEL